MTAGEEGITVNSERTLRPMSVLSLAVAALALLLTASTAHAAPSVPQVGAEQSVSSRPFEAVPDNAQTVPAGKPAALTGAAFLKGGEVAAVTVLPRAGAGMGVTVALPGEAALFVFLAGGLFLVALAVARHRPCV